MKLQTMFCVTAVHVYVKRDMTNGCMHANSHSFTADNAKSLERCLFKHYKLVPLVFDAHALRSETDNEMILQNAAPDRA